MKSFLFTICSLLVISFVFAGCSDDWQKAERSAKDYASNLTNTIGKVSCAKKDTDGDGYCSCTVFLKGGKVQPLECGCEKYCFSCVEGCKVAMPKVINRSK